MPTKVLSVRISDEMQNMLSYLQEKTLLNNAAIIRYAVAKMYYEDVKSTNIDTNFEVDIYENKN